MGKSFEREMTVPVAAASVQQRLLEVLQTLPRTSVQGVGAGVVQASVGTGLASWGEDLTVHLTQVPGGTGVHIRSQCSFPLQLIDWGKNKRNVELVAQGLAVPGPQPTPLAGFGGPPPIPPAGPAPAPPTGAPLAPPTGHGEGPGTPGPGSQPG